jgi:UDP-N-acetylmuramoyl-tripeptide--D-alanyl-D-alanine ligase
MRAALQYLAVCPGRRVAVLGDMRELGDMTGHYHRELGEFLAGTALARVFLFGNDVEGTYAAMRGRGAGPEAMLFRDGEALSSAIAQSVAPGDVVLFKASRGVKLEAVAERVKVLLGASAHAGSEVREVNA